MPGRPRIAPPTAPRAAPRTAPPAGLGPCSRAQSRHRAERERASASPTASVEIKIIEMRTVHFMTYLPSVSLVVTRETGPILSIEARKAQLDFGLMRSRVQYVHAMARSSQF